MKRALTRRHLFRAGAAAASAWAVAARFPTDALGLAEPETKPAPAHAGAAAAVGEELVPFLESQPDPHGRMLKWDELADWITPTDHLFDVNHYGKPKVEIDPAAWKLQVTGLVDKPLSLSLDDIKSRPKQERIATLECSGNGANPGFSGAIGNLRWTGTSLAALLHEAGAKPEAIEAAFYGLDTGKEKIRTAEVEETFARTLPIDQTRRPDVLLCYEVNGKPLPPGHGFPVRLVVPGWYGIAWVKWLSEIELRDRRLMNRFTARDYVTLRGHEQNGKTLFRETSVGPMNVKSLVARVTRLKDGTLRITGAAWTQGTIKSVELKVDDNAWAPVQLIDPPGGKPIPDTWRFWSYELKDPAPGTHTLVSRATDEAGRVQPTEDDPAIRLKKTYWEANQQVVRKIKV